MSSARSYEVDQALERARAAVVAGDVQRERLEEAELHAPLCRQHHEPMEVDPNTEAILRALLGSKPAQSKPAQ